MSVLTPASPHCLREESICATWKPALRSFARVITATMPIVTFEGFDYPLSADENMLDGMIQGGAPVLYSCRRGSCRTCTLQTDTQSVELLRNNPLPSNLREAGMFLPCVARCTTSLEVRRPDWTTCFVEGLVAKKEFLEAEILRLTIEPPLQFVWHAGQYVELRSPDGDVRPYAAASVRASDYYLELLVQCRAQGAVSSWLANDLQVNDIVYLRGPLGNCHYTKTLQSSDLLLLTSGVGVGSLLAIAREAQKSGHARRVELFSHAATPPPRYLASELTRLQSEWSQFSFAHIASAIDGTDEAAEAWWPGHRDLSETAVFIFGEPGSVERDTSLAMQHRCVPSRLFVSAFHDAMVSRA